MDFRRGTREGEISFGSDVSFVKASQYYNKTQEAGLSTPSKKIGLNELLVL